MTQQINACICELNISVWTARKYDKTSSKELQSSKNANSNDAVRANKNLMAGMDNLKRITEFVAVTRNEFYAMTLPWSDSGQRMLPMMQFFEMKQWLNDRESTFNSLVADFITAYPTLISAQAFQLGALFDRNEYPLVADITNKFRFKVGFLPLPTAGDFRIDATQDIVDDMAKEYAKMYDERINQVNQDLWTRLHDTLRHMHDRLGFTDDGKKKIFRDTMVDNAVELCDLLKRLNVTNDPKLESARKELESMLLGVDADDLREDNARVEASGKIESILGSWF